MTDRITIDENGDVLLDWGWLNEMHNNGMTIIEGMREYLSALPDGEKKRRIVDAYKRACSKLEPKP